MSVKLYKSKAEL